MSPGGRNDPIRPLRVDPERYAGTARLSLEDEAREGEVLRRLRGAADGTGFLRFDRFVDIVLYGPDVGYYTWPGVALGPRGDFYTAAHATPLFGQAVTRWLLGAYERLGRPEFWTVAEIGAGDGRLAAELVRGLARGLPAEARTVYRLIELSPPLRRVAATRAREAAGGGRISIREAEDLASDGPFLGAVVANEVLDALPFQRLVRRDGAWRELGVRVGEAGVEWAEGAAARPSGEPLPDAEDGARIEWSPAAEALPREVADHLAAGAALFIDYGFDEEPTDRSPSSGGLSAIRGHRGRSDPLEHPGLCDLSAFVSFARVRRAAASSGLVEVSYRTLRESLAEWGIAELIEAAARGAPGPEQEVRVRLSAKNLLFGFEAFRVLDLSAPATR